jgi:photosystem II stability/assembly factor-like uncharacterized protein
MRTSVIFLSLYLLSQTTLAQSGWFPQTSGTTADLNSVFFVNPDTGWAVGTIANYPDYDAVILKTTDGGETWSSQSIFVGVVGDTWLNSVSFINSDTGWVVGAYLGPIPMEYPVQLIGKTTDGGINWDFITGEEGVLYSAHIIDDNAGWTVGYLGSDVLKGCILKLTSEGWIDISDTLGSYMGDPFSSVYFTNSQTGWIIREFCGSDTVNILATTDGGASWNFYSCGTWLWLRSVHFTNDSTGWVVGEGIFYTTDGGTNWNMQSNEWTYSVYFVNDSIGWAVGSPPITILHTSDGGINWIPQLSGTSFGLRSVFFINDSTGWAVGDSGTILKTTTGGVVGIEEALSVPQSFELMQNYPNPFNPSTTIRYTLPKATHVTLRIYNLLGQEIRALINTQQFPGEHTITWNGTDNLDHQVSSGIYIYQIKAGDFMESRKMVLLR